MEKSKVKILLVEDDQSLGIVVKDFLSLSGYDCQLEVDGISAWDTFQSRSFDLCILDVMLPSMDGFSLAEKIRRIDINVPILFLTSKQSKEDRITGFKIGADDYITKPFNIEELILRIEVFLKRSKNKVNVENIFQIGEYTFDYNNLLLQKGNSKQVLSQKEADILRLLCVDSGNILKRDDLLKSVWGSDDYFKGRSLDVFISKLRKYLKNDPRIEIQNLYSIGFRLKVNSET